ncbi:sulfotransferase family protein [Bacillus piscicola]|uniref:sulfotransferase family protein n=1 Tax=Bacillus piscicola TaxID=1632684 RepID=UPI001F09FD69|nr:sulfotransferase [Bacillus piscicola]
MFKDIISIHGVPRSGTTWLGQILNSSDKVRYKYQPLFSYAFKDAINVRSAKEEINEFYKKLYYYEDDFLDQKGQIAKGYSPSFKYKDENPPILMTKMVRYHYLIPQLLKNLENIKFLFIVRNPCSALNSWRNSPNEFPADIDFNSEWRFAQNRNEFKPEEYFGFEKWKEATKIFLEMNERYPNKVLIIKYEDLVKDPLKFIREIFEFCNLEIKEETISFLEQSRTQFHKDPYSVFKGKVDIEKWREQLDNNIAMKIYDELKGSEFEEFL